MRTRLSFDEALAAVLADLPRPQVERVPLQSALGRVLASDVHAPFDLPGFANSAMDGFAVRAADLTAQPANGLPIADTLLAGDTRRHVLPAGHAMAIMTGAPMPDGADTVVIRENARVDGDCVVLPDDAAVGANVRDADDDCARGTQVAATGELVSPARLGVLAAVGASHVDVARRPRVAVLATGDELVALGQMLAFGQRHDSNGPMLAACVLQAGAELVSVERCGDEPAALAAALTRLCRSDVDVVLTSGGVSAGDADHLPSTIGALGEVCLWKVRMKPGMPFLHGRIGTTRVFALPGNPVSVGVTFHMLVRPVLEALLGRARAMPSVLPMRLASPWSKRHARLEFLRVRLTLDGAGGWLAQPLTHQGSGALSRLADADALVRLEEGEREYPAGELLAGVMLPGQD